MNLVKQKKKKKTEFFLALKGKKKYKRKLSKKENVESHETISLYIINDSSSNRWDPIINFAICFSLRELNFPFHYFAPPSLNVHQVLKSWFDS